MVHVRRAGSPKPYLLVLPRPGSDNDLAAAPKPPFPAPPEERFTTLFGHLLPPATYIHTPRGKIAYFSLPPPSPGSGTPDKVLILHGGQTPSLGLQPLASALQSRFPHAHIVLMDWWGHGLTDTPNTSHIPELFNEQISTLLDALSWSRVHIFGFSFGGIAAATYAVHYPKRVASLVLAGPAGMLPLSVFPEEIMRGDDEQKTQDWMFEFLEGGPMVVPQDWEERVKKGEVVTEALRDWEKREHPGHAASIVAILRDGGVLARHDVYRQLAQLGIPTRFVIGENDEMCSEAEVRTLGFKDVVVLPNVGHSDLRDKVSQVSAVIAEFWKTL
ncbi:hypothetical protein ANO11243_027600 [Dothideomycetidae sp. 11243]|nr:hypothetical protein ANO11243_027600 [fungal sp. No.11243]